MHRLVHTVRHRASRVELMEERLQICHDLDTIRQHLVPYLITARPEHHASVIAVVLHHIGDIPFPPLVELFVIVILGLSTVPYIERLNHHHHTHLVAQFNQLRVRHVMTRTNCIATHVLQHRYLVTQRIFVHRSAERT